MADCQYCEKTSGTHDRKCFHSDTDAVMHFRDGVQDGYNSILHRSKNRYYILGWKEGQRRAHEARAEVIAQKFSTDKDPTRPIEKEEVNAILENAGFFQAVTD